MVDALAADPSLSIQEAARRAVAGMEGVTSSHVERLRKKLRKLRATGKLPQPRGGSGGDPKLDELREVYRRSDAFFQDTRLKLAAAEQEAESIGLDLTQPNLPGLYVSLERERNRLRALSSNVSLVAHRLQAEGVSDPEEAATILSRLLEDERAADREFEVLQRILRLRNLLGIPA